MANAVALLLLINSPSAPELMFEFLKYNPVPPPPAVLLYTLVDAVAVGFAVPTVNVKTGETTISPVPLAVKVKSWFERSVLIESMPLRSLLRFTLI